MHAVSSSLVCLPEVDAGEPPTQGSCVAAASADRLHARALLLHPCPFPRCQHMHTHITGGFGPKLESWAFGVDQAGLAALVNETVFAMRTCKLCKARKIPAGLRWGGACLPAPQT